MVTAVCLVIDALGALSKRRQDKAKFAFSSKLSGQVGAAPTEAGTMLPLAPSGSVTLSNVTRSFERVGCCLGVAVTISGGGDGLVFLFFF